MGVFHFRQFDIDDRDCGMKICSDSVTFGAWFLPQHTQAHTVLDIGAGSGLLSLMAAQCMPHAEITGIEIDEAAAAAAEHNFAASQWSRRLKIENTDFSLFTPSSAVDIIIFAFARQHLAPDGHLGLILPADRADDIIFEAELAALKLRRFCSVIPREGKAPVRALFDFSPTDGPCASESIVIRDSNGIVTDRYTAIVQPFYTKIS